MHLFNTEMIFLHPPRTRFAYGRHAPRLPRYGRRAAARIDAKPPRLETVVIATATPAAVERAVVERAA